MKTNRKLHLAIIIILALLASAIAAVVAVLLSGRGDNEKISHGDGLFSWHDEVFEEEERETLFRLMREQGLTEIYQDVPFDTPVSEIKDFAEDCRENGIKPYLLVGEPEWALDRSGDALRAQIQRAALMGFDGVMADIEPGSTDEWKEDRASVMKTMTKAFLRSYDAAKENGVEMIVCLSYYYDDYGFDDELETIVEGGCDALAIMNYNREDETGQIETEAALCRAYGKRLINIYELQEVGKFDLEESHTYREAGLSALKESRERVLEYFGDQEISSALHEYRALKEMSEQ